MNENKIKDSNNETRYPNNISQTEVRSASVLNMLSSTTKGNTKALYSPKTKGKRMIETSMPIRFKFGSYKELDIERLKEENLRLKAQANKNNKDFNTLRIDFLKLEEDNFKCLKFLGNLISEGTKRNYDLATMISQAPSHEDVEKEINIKTVNLNTENTIKMREIFVIGNLKKQIMSLKQLLREKDDEAKAFKANSKFTRLQNLERDLKIKDEECVFLTEKIDHLNYILYEKDGYIRNCMEEKDYFKNKFLKMKINFEENEKYKHFATEQNFHSDKKVKYTEKLKLSHAALKNNIKEKEKEIEYWKDKAQKLENYEDVKLSLEKKKKKKKKKKIFF